MKWKVEAEYRYSLTDMTEEEIDFLRTAVVYGTKQSVDGNKYNTMMKSLLEKIRKMMNSVRDDDDQL